MSIGDLAYWILCIGVLIPMTVVIVETVAALVPGPAVRFGGRPRCAALVPAHNEETGIAATLACLRPQMAERDRIVVVADHCTDHTARIAFAAGAEVIERSAQDGRGKGFALQWGIDYLSKDAPEVVVIVDADCRVHAGSVDRLVRQVAATGCPAQSINVPDETNPRKPSRPSRYSPVDQLSAFAFVFKNVVRPLGLARMRMPCLVTTGTAYSFACLNRIHLATDHLVEDMNLGVDLAVQGTPARLCIGAHISSELPTSHHARWTQRTRWEQGHLHCLLTQVPRLLWQAIRQGRLDLLALACELCVPPLSLLLMAWLMAIAWGALRSVQGGEALSLFLLGETGLVMAGCITIAWAHFGQNYLSWKALLAAPAYLFLKIPIYVGFLIHRETKWIRTERQTSPKGGA